MTVYCNVKSCRHQESGMCAQDWIIIGDPVLEGASPECTDYEERDDDPAEA